LIVEVTAVIVILLVAIDLRSSTECFGIPVFSRSVISLTFLGFWNW
jgi:hypothetical protein